MSSTLQEPKKGLGKVATVFACGLALFSDGYVNANSGPTRYILQRAYPGSYTSNYGTLFSSLVFVGVIIGQVTFGYICDRVGRKVGMLFASVWLAFWSLIAGLAYGGDNPANLWKCLIAYRFLLGIGIGAEYPAGSVAASENTEDEGAPKAHQQKFLVLSTNTAIDVGFVVAYIVPLICLQIFGEGRLEWVWRLTFGFGMVVPLLVLPFRIAMQEPKLYQQGSGRRLKFFDLPWKLIFKRYWTRLLGVSFTWFVYDWVAYPAGIYSSTIVSGIIPNGTMTQNLTWDMIINAFYLPGTIVGALFVDWLGPKYCMIVGFLCQSIIGFAMSGCYDSLKRHVGGFAVVYGLYLAFGEFGPGNNLGVLAAKGTGPTVCRGIFYSIAAVVGKVGAFVATYVYTPIINDLGGAGTTRGDTGPVYIGSALCFVGAIATYFLIPNVRTDFMSIEEEKFRVYLQQNGYDPNKLGLAEPNEESRSFLRTGSDDKADNGEKTVPLQG